jgi:2,5-diketo-D-gluconate reductase B
VEFIEAGGMTLPKLGLGTWRLSGPSGTDSVLGALALGYRHIDTAQRYDNEGAVGEALATSGVPRGEIHLTTKVWFDSLARDAMRRSIEASLQALRTQYVDLFLIHWPSREMDLGAALESLVSVREAGLARHIGVSNFTVPLLRRALDEFGAPLVCNQVEYHVLLDQSKLLSFMRERGLALAAYSPLAQGRLAEHPELAGIARKHGATPSQVALRWLLDQDIVAAIPKAARRESQQANLDALGLKLDDQDRATIAALPKDVRLVSPGWHPGWD